MKAKNFLPEGYTLHEVTSNERQIAAYMMKVDEKISDTTDSFIIIDPDGNAVGYAELYHNHESDDLIETGDPLEPMLEATH